MFKASFRSCNEENGSLTTASRQPMMPSKGAHSIQQDGVRNTLRIFALFLRGRTPPNEYSITSQSYRLGHRELHRPSLVHIGLKLPTIHSTPKKRWNFRKADWERYNVILERSVSAIPTRSISIQEAYDRFQRAVFCVARSSIPRGFRPVYTPCLDSKCQALLKEFEESGDPDVADLLIDSLDMNRHERWEQSISGF